MPQMKAAKHSDVTSNRGIYRAVGKLELKLAHSASWLFSEFTVHTLPK